MGRRVDPGDDLADSGWVPIEALSNLITFPPRPENGYLNFDVTHVVSVKMLLMSRPKKNGRTLEDNCLPKHDSFYKCTKKRQLLLKFSEFFGFGWA